MNVSKPRENNHLFNSTAELELLVSGALVFGAYQMSDGTRELIAWALNHNIPSNSLWLIVLTIIALFFSTIVPISILIHFFFRVYWLALVGLKTAFQAQDPEQDPPSSYPPMFERIIGRSLDIEAHIGVVNTVSSCIFAFSFLMIFSFCLSFLPCYLLFAGVGFLDQLGGPFLDFVSGLLNLGLSLGALLYMIDFFSLGSVKKSPWRWLRRLYFPFYVFYSWISLSFLYRGIYYYLIAHTSRKWLAFFLIIYFSLTIFLFNQGYYANSLLPYVSLKQPSHFEGLFKYQMFYEDEMPEAYLLHLPYIESYIVPRGKYSLRLSVPVIYQLEDHLLQVCDSIRPFVERGWHWRRTVTFSFNRLWYPRNFNVVENTRGILNCFSGQIELSLNGKGLERNDFYYDFHPESGRLVFSKMIALDSLEKGRHLLRVSFPEVFPKYRYDIPFYLD